jgi:hypothetical protein
MERRGERGEGRFGSIIGLLILAAVVYCAWNAGPAYVANWELKDKMQETARLPRGTYSDDKILDVLEKYLREEQLTPYVSRSSFRINTRDTGRGISVVYERKVKFLPGIERSVRFEPSVDQTILF